MNEFNACENLGQGDDNIMILYPQQAQLSTSSCFLFCFFVCLLSSPQGSQLGRLLSL